MDAAMKVLMTGKGSSGSWQCRGVQLGNALGATVRPLATREDFKAADISVIVKRVPVQLLQDVRAAGKPWVYDIVDAYKQPESSRWTRDQAIKWAHEHLAALKPDAVIWPNRKMREDCDPGLPGMVLPHHHRPGIRNNPIRKHVKRVGYEGAVQYLAEWEQALAAECKRRGWEFVTNPKHLADLDIVVAMRGGDWDGYVPHHWKSNVKLANAHGSGTPFIGQMESGYIETATGCEYWARNTDSLATCFNWLEDQSAREQIHDRFVQAAFPVEQAAADLKGWLSGL
jgi:hypothetical protein